MGRKRNTQGFTIIELLVVIVVLAVLMSVTVAAYGGIQQRSKNAAILTQVNQWAKILSLYKVEKGSYPLSSYSCVGNDVNDFAATDAMPLGRCQEIGGVLH